MSHYFQYILFLIFFSMRPMPSKTLVMSYILLFCTYSIGEFKFMSDTKRKSNRYFGQNLLYKKRTCKVSAALFKSRIPSSARLSKWMNFFVKRPVKFLYKFLMFILIEITRLIHIQKVNGKSLLINCFQNYLRNCHNDSYQQE